MSKTQRHMRKLKAETSGSLNQKNFTGKDKPGHIMKNNSKVPAKKNVSPDVIIETATAPDVSIAQRIRNLAQLGLERSQIASILMLRHRGIVWNVLAK